MFIYLSVSSVSRSVFRNDVNIYAKVYFSIERAAY